MKPTKKAPTKKATPRRGRPATPEEIKAAKKGATNADEPATTAAPDAKKDKAHPKGEATSNPKAPKADLMTFAFRLPKSESAEIHKAAGPGKASQFARSVLLAAARKDEAAIAEILKGIAS